VSGQVIFLTHAAVVVDPAVPVPDWGLSDIGRARHEAFASDPVLQGVTAVYSSTERKAREGAIPVAAHLGLKVQEREALGENDRSATGYLPEAEFWPVLAAFFGQPDVSTRGWETARDAQTRIVSAVRQATQEAPEGDTLIVAHGGVGNLLRCALQGIEITQNEGQPHPKGGVLVQFSARHGRGTYGMEGGMTPLLSVQGITKRYGAQIGCADVSFDLFPGEVMGIVGESGSGKSTLLNCMAGHLAPDHGAVIYDTRADGPRDTVTMSEPERRMLGRTDWAFVHQNPRDGLRMGVSAGGNVGERLMAVGARHYGDIREQATDWLTRVEIDAGRVDDRPGTFSGGMQQRLQIARNLVTGPRLVFMDEPTGGLDVSVQARLLDLLRGLVRDLGLSAIIVTHDLAVVRLLADRLMVMKSGNVVEQGLTDQVLDDPQHAYTQLLVSSVLQV
jgi:putative phosphonate transport system ATP-binding protein